MPNHLAVLGLTDKQERFARHVARTGNLSDSAIMAGYTTDNEGFRLARLPIVRQAIELEIHWLLQSESAPIARAALHRLVSTSTNERIVVDAAKVLLDRAGFTPPVHEKGEGAERQLSDMTAAELKEFIGKHEAEIDRVTGELAARATPVNAHDNAPMDEAMPINTAAFLD